MHETQTRPSTTLDELKQLRQWVAWEYRPRPGKKPAKAPIDPDEWGDASTTDPSTWGTYEQALAASPDGNLGFVFTEDDGYCGIDLDDCIDPETGQVAPWATEIVDLLDSYTEFSPSGEGLHILVKGSKPGSRCRLDQTSGEVEIYDQGRFFTLTGRQYGDCDDIQSRQVELEELYARLFGEPKEDLHGVVTEGGFTGDDQALLDKARSNAVTGESFVKLYDRGLWHGYKSQSEADLWLLEMLAFWTARDPERMERLFMGSGLALTLDRKSNPNDYLDRTIIKAIKGCGKVYDPNYGTKSRPRVTEILNSCLKFWSADSWSGRSGTNDRDVYKALIDTGLKYGRVRDGEGVEISASLRDLALAANIGSTNTVREALKRLEDKCGLIVKVGDGGKRTAATYLILVDSNPIHKQTCKYYVSVTSQIRNPSPTIQTIGKRNGQIIEFVRAKGGRVVTLEEISTHLNMRKNNLKSRNISTLLDGFLEEKDGGYVVPDDIEDRLETFLEESGSREATELQRQRYERDRKAYEHHRNGTALTVVEEPTPITTVLIEKVPEMRRNLPEKNKHQIYDHGTECGCFWCDDDAPEYVPVSEEERTAA